MTEARKRNLLQLNLNKVAAHSPAARRFVEKYGQTESLANRQALMNNAIANGFLMEESGLFTLLRVMDTDEFAAMDRAQRNADILRGAGFFAGLPTPDAPPVAVKPVQLTIEALEHELLSDNGLLASAPATERTALLEKVLAKYDAEFQTTLFKEATRPDSIEPSKEAEKKQEDSADSKPAMSISSEEDASHASLPRAKGNAKAKRVFKGA